MATKKYAVARATEIPPGTRKLVMVAGRPVVVFNIRREFFALLNKCPHQGAPLCEGRLTGVIRSDEPGRYTVDRPDEILRCPWHGWEFDLRNGQSYFNPAHTKAKTYSVGVSSGDELMKGPFKAETFPVSLEESYVVLEM